MSGNIYIIQLATISVKVTRQASYTGIYIYIHGVDTVCTDSFDGEEKGSGKVKPEGRAEKSILSYCPFIAERYSGKKIINLTDAGKLFFIQTAQN